MKKKFKEFRERLFRWLKKARGLGAGLLLTGLSWLARPFYGGLTVYLGYYSYIFFAPISGFIGWIMIRFFAKDQKTLEEMIEEKIKGERRKKFFLKIFNASKLIAFLLIAVSTGPYLTPIFVRSCVKRIKRAYIYAILLNMSATSFWIFIYFVGWETIKALFKF